MPLPVEVDSSDNDGLLSSLSYSLMPIVVVVVVDVVVVAVDVIVIMIWVLKHVSYRYY